ncbi:hypothetical protein ACYOEI_01430 [Singulisphaera rosea]
MIRYSGFMLMLAVFGLEAGGGETDSEHRVADFKLAIEEFEVRKEPVRTVEMIVHGGRVYQIITKPGFEVVLYEPTADRVEIVDLARKVRTEVALRKVETLEETRRQVLNRTRDVAEAKPSPSNSSPKDLLQQPLAVSFDRQARRLSLSNQAFEVEAIGEPEADRGRLDLIAKALVTLEKVNALRNPRPIPPFPTLEAVRTLVEGHRLRPSEITVLYRLTGPPRKVRSTYRVTPNLTTREVEALERIHSLMARSRFVRLEEYKDLQSR